MVSEIAEQDIKMLKERTRLEKEVELLTQVSDDSFRELNHNESGQIKSKDAEAASLEISPKFSTVRGRILWPALGVPLSNIPHGRRIYWPVSRG